MKQGSQCLFIKSALAATQSSSLGDGELLKILEGGGTDLMRGGCFRKRDWPDDQVM